MIKTAEVHGRTGPLQPHISGQSTKKELPKKLEGTKEAVVLEKPESDLAKLFINSLANT